LRFGTQKNQKRNKSPSSPKFGGAKEIQNATCSHHQAPIPNANVPALAAMGGPWPPEVCALAVEKMQDIRIDTNKQAANVLQAVFENIWSKKAGARWGFWCDFGTQKKGLFT
jgi:hypothetical protein